MENTAPTNTNASKRDFRWLWRAGWIVLALAAGLALYLVLTARRPVIYSPATTVRPSPEYERKLDPARSNRGVEISDTNPPPVVTVTTNAGQIHVSYPAPQNHSVETLGFVQQRMEGSEKLQLGDVSLKLKRIGFAWTPPPTNSPSGTSSPVPAKLYPGKFYSTDGTLKPVPIKFHSVGVNVSPVPAQFYDAELKPVADAEVLRALPELREREMMPQWNYPTYRFDLELLGGPWMVLESKLYDATTHAPLGDEGWHQPIKDGHSYNVAPFLWRQAPVELMIDLVTGPVEEEEILPQPGAYFTIGGCRYYLLYATDSADPSSQRSDAKTVSLTFTPFSGQRTSRKQSFLYFKASPYAAKTAFQMDYLDAEGKLFAWHDLSLRFPLRHYVSGELAAIKKIRVRKYTRGHRVVIRLPALPALPTMNQNMDDLFQVRTPLLKFERRQEQEEYIQRMTQLVFGFNPTTNPPTSIYPRWFTNATPVEVLEDYAQVMGVSGQLYVDQEKLQIRKDDRSGALEVKEKLLKLWEKLKGP